MFPAVVQVQALAPSFSNSFNPFSRPYERIECLSLSGFLVFPVNLHRRLCFHLPSLHVVVAGMFHRFTRVLPGFLSWLGPSVWFLCLFCVVLVGLCCFLVWFFDSAQREKGDKRTAVC